MIVSGRRAPATVVRCEACGTLLPERSLHTACTACGGLLVAVATGHHRSIATVATRSRRIGVDVGIAAVHHPDPEAREDDERTRQSIGSHEPVL